MRHHVRERETRYDYELLQTVMLPRISFGPVLDAGSARSSRIRFGATFYQN